MAKTAATKDAEKSSRSAKPAKVEETGATDPFVDAVRANLSAPSSRDLEDEPRFDVVDDALMKRGTLAHGSIDWSEVQEAALDLLKVKAKDLRLVEAMCLSLTQNPTRETFLSAFQGLLAFLDLDPATRQPANQKQFETQLGRVVGNLSRKDLPGPDGELKADLTSALGALASHELIRAAGLGKSFADMRARLDLEVEKVAGDRPSEAGKPVQKAAVNSPAIAAQAASDKGGDAAKETDWRALKRSAGEIADILFDLDPTAPVSYQLRRTVTWGDITASPPIREGNKTIVPPVAVDTVDRYSLALSSGTVDRDVVKRLERTLQSMPFWLDGHKLAADFAALAGRKAVQEAILADLSRLLKRFPELADLEFADGTPLASQETLNALEGTSRLGAEDDEGAESSQPSKENPLPAPADLSRLVSGEGEAESWNRTFRNARSPRTRTLMEIDVLEQLSGAGLFSLAADQAGRLKDWAKGHSIAEWDPEIVARLDALNNRSGK
ncbi:TssA family type VI secretion system protein [Roseibium sediminis]|uniref:TssA family type VI secretion system protein n=1 Tax=Roseibium sediminis TaxID=1775174 RepID=UPI00123D24BB|nr:TssA family type VI secretion system protein [Roseibium sediminis]